MAEWAAGHLRNEPSGTSRISWEAIIHRLGAVICIAVFFLVPSVARGDWRQFIPKITGMEGYLETDASMESSKDTTNNKGLDVKYTLISEELKLGASGYIYHPRFVVFLAKVGGGFDQEDLSNNEHPENNGWRNHAIFDYEFRVVVLPEHPYNLEVYAIRANPFIPGRLSPGITTLSIDEGAILKYKKMPFFGMLGYQTSEIDTLDTNVKNRALNANAGYVINWMTTSASANRTNTSSFSASGTTESYSAQNNLQLIKRRLFVVSDASFDTLKQEDESGFLNDRRFAWNEQIGAELPWRFSSNLNYNHFSDTSTTNSGVTTENTETSKSDNVAFSITHRLFASLLTTYNFTYAKSTTNTGDFNLLGNGINAVYTKNIPGGQLIVTFTADTSRTDEKGSPTVINEIHDAPLFGQFTLQKPDVDVQTIVIRVKDPVSGLLVNLQQNANYLVFQVGNTVQIVITSLPPDVQGTNPPTFVYEFRVSYSVTTQNATLQTNDIGYTVKFQLFDNLISPYYNYLHSTQKLISGALLGGTENLTSNTFGITVEKMPYRLIAEYHKVQSLLNPQNGYRAEAYYIKTLNPSANLYVKGYYSKITYLPSLALGTKGYTETIYGGDLRMQKSFLNRNMILTGAASYVNRTGLIATTTYYFNSSLTWKIAKLDFSLGADVGRMTSELSTGREESIYQYYYLSVKRKLF
jgi:hypothetical protein